MADGRFGRPSSQRVGDGSANHYLSCRIGLGEKVAATKLGQLCLNQESLRPEALGAHTHIHEASSEGSCSVPGSS